MKTKVLRKPFVSYDERIAMGESAKEYGDQIKIRVADITMCLVKGSIPTCISVSPI